MTDASLATSEATVVIVPHTPGPLVDLDAAVRGRPRDEIDDVVDELLGPDIAGAPGRIDVVLLLAGAGLLLWNQLGPHSTGLVVLGVILVFLGLVLPARS